MKVSPKHKPKLRRFVVRCPGPEMLSDVVQGEPKSSLSRSEVLHKSALSDNPAVLISEDFFR